MNVDSLYDKYRLSLLMWSPPWVKHLVLVYQMQTVSTKFQLILYDNILLIDINA